MPARRLSCTCCGLWRVTEVRLEFGPRLRVTHRGYFQGDCRSVAEVAALLERFGGPGLARFEAE